MAYLTLPRNKTCVCYSADDLEKLTTLGVFGLDGSAGGETEMTSLRELHIAMLGIRDGLAEAKRHWKSAEESADKCQVGRR